MATELASAPVRAAPKPSWRLAPSSILLPLLASIVLSRLALLLFSQWLPGDDGLRYLQEAQNLVHYNTFSLLAPPSPAPTVHDVPLFPLLLSAVLRLLADPTAAMRCVGCLNALFFTVAAAALFGLSRLFTTSTRLFTTSTRLPAIATGLFALFPESFPDSLFSMPESLFLMLFLSAVFLLATFLKGAPPWRFFAAFVLLGASILAKPASLFFAAVFVFCAVCFWPRPKQTLPGRAFGVPTLTTITGTNLFDANYEIMLEDQHVPNPAAVMERQMAGKHSSNPVIEAQVKGAIAKREIAAHWRSYLVTNLKRHPRLYQGTGALALLRLVGNSRGVSALELWQAHPALAPAKMLPDPVLLLQLACWLFLGLLYAGAALGAFLLRHRDWFALAFSALPLLYFAVVIGPVVYTRYRLPMDPFLAILAAHCFTKEKAYVLV